MMVREAMSIDELSAIERRLRAQPRLKISNDSFMDKGYYCNRKKLLTVMRDILWKTQLFSTRYACNGKLQCYQGKRRSQSDLYRILIYYRPEVTFAEFRKTMIELINRKYVICHFCTNINKRVFVVRNKLFKRGMYSPMDGPDELGTTFRHIYTFQPEFQRTMELFEDACREYFSTVEL